jgi:hypothetical protein
VNSTLKPELNKHRHKETMPKSDKPPQVDEKWSRASEIADIFHPSAEAIERLQNCVAAVDSAVARALAASIKSELQAEIGEINRLYKDETKEIINSYNTNLDVRGLRDHQILGRFRVLQSRSGQDLRTRLQKVAALMRVQMVMRAAGIPLHPSNWLAQQLV